MSLGAFEPLLLAMLLILSPLPIAVIMWIAWRLQTRKPRQPEGQRDKGR